MEKVSRRRQWKGMKLGKGDWSHHRYPIVQPCCELRRFGISWVSQGPKPGGFHPKRKAIATTVVFSPELQVFAAFDCLTVCLSDFLLQCQGGEDWWKCLSQTLDNVLSKFQYSDAISTFILTVAQVHPGRLKYMYPWIPFSPPLHSSRNERSLLSLLCAPITCYPTLWYLHQKS